MIQRYSINLKKIRIEGNIKKILFITVKHFIKHPNDQSFFYYKDCRKGILKKRFYVIIILISNFFNINDYYIKIFKIYGHL